MKEEWTAVKGYEGLYEVSNFGNVKNSKTGKRLSLLNSGNGYLKVHLCKCGKVNRYWVHRLVAEAFISNFNNLPVVDHKDGNKRNNSVENLEWCTQKENSIRAWKNGLTPKPPIHTGENNINHVLTKKQVLQIRSLYAEGLYSQRKIANKFGVSQTTIRLIVNDKAWKDDEYDVI